MFIPGQIISLVTFPGVIVHELAHEVACKLTKTPVYDVCYFRVGNPSGYVIHENSTDLHKSMFISIGPFLFNTLLGIILTFPVSLRILTFESSDPLDILLFWLGFSVLMHAFPSSGDVKNMFKTLNTTPGHILSKILYYPITALMSIGAFGSVIWLDAVYSVLAATVIPMFIVSLFV